MKSVVIYYSYSGNTQKVADILAKLLAEKGEVERIELVGLDEAKTFLGQAKRALFRKRAAIQPVSFDLSGYDLICFGTPVWAFAPAPAINTYLDKCFGLENKNVILFATFGSGTGKERCLNYMQKILAKKGIKQCKRFSIQQFKVSDGEFVSKVLVEMMRL